MKFAGLAIAILTVALVAFAPAAQSAQARPWLCRDKPVFSASSPMRYQVTREAGGRRWRLLLMSFDPMGGHDGFTIVHSRDLGSSEHRVGGQIAAGRYFAVAQYLEGGEWICPGYSQLAGTTPSGEIAEVCYGAESTDCAVKLNVMPANADASPGAR